MIEIDPRTIAGQLKQLDLDTPDGLTLAASIADETDRIQTGREARDLGPSLRDLIATGSLAPGKLDDLLTDSSFQRARSEQLLSVLPHVRRGIHRAAQNELSDDLVADLAGVVVANEAVIIRALEVLGSDFDIDAVKQLGPTAIGSLDAWIEADRKLSLVHALRSAYGRAHGEPKMNASWYLAEFSGSADDLQAATASMTGAATGLQSVPSMGSPIVRLVHAGHRVTVNTHDEAARLVATGVKASADLEEQRRQAEVDADKAAKANVKRWKQYAERAAS